MTTTKKGREIVVPKNKIKNIFGKMLEATKEIEKVKKGLTIEMGKNSYKAVGEGDVLEAVKPIEALLGIYSYPVSREVVEKGRYTVKTKYGENEMFMLRIEVTYRFVNIEDPSDYLDIKSYGDGWDGQDKAPGKAMTYADKYALLKAYKIETGEDSEKEASGEVKSGDVIHQTQKLKSEGNYRQLLPKKLKDLGILEEMAVEYKLNKTTTEDRAKEVYDELVEKGVL